MEASRLNMTPVSEDVQQSIDLPPLCCTGALPAPASWESRHWLPHLPHIESGLSRRWSYIAVAYTMTATATGLNLLTPLYSMYRQRFSFSTLTLTLIFATYVVTIIPAMLLFGPLADAIGRRRILLIAVLTAAIGAVLVLLASSTPWLFAARIMQGSAQGAVSGAASAALIELGTNLKKTSLVIGTTVTSGIALGPIISGTLAQYAPAPLVLPFIVYLILLIPALLGSLFMTESLAPANRRAFHPHRPNLPAQGRRDFLISTAVSALGFSNNAIFLSVMPVFLIMLLHTTNIALLTAPVGLFLAASPIVQLLLHNLSARRAAMLGLILEIIGLSGTLVTAAIGSLPLLLLTSVIGGGGSGLAYLGSLSFVNQIVPKEQRGDVFGIYYALNYLCLGATAIGVGLLSLSLGLSTAVRWIAAIIVVLCALTTLATARMAPST